MGDPLVELVPNVSVSGTKLVEALREACEGDGVVIGDIHTDSDHNRSVVTMVATCAAAPRVATRLAQFAWQHGNAGSHEGVHPHVGFVDVFPVVPLADLCARGASVSQAQEVAERCAHEFGSAGIPCINYGIGTKWSFAGALRRGGVQGLQQRIATGEVQVVAGPTEIPVATGVTLTGTRNVLIACNAILAPGAANSLAAAQQSAATIRESGGGIPGLRAIARKLPLHKRTQIAMNIERWEDGEITQAFTQIRDRHDIESIELVGCAPQEVIAAMRWFGYPMNVEADDRILEDFVVHAERVL